MSLRISVVIPTYQRPKLLERCLTALIAQELEPADYEIIVVDDGPASGVTRKTVEKFQTCLYTGLTTVPASSAIPKNGHNHHNQASASLTSLMLETNVSLQVKEKAVEVPAIRYLPASQTTGPAAARNLGWRSAQAEIIAFTDDDTIPDPNWLSNGLKIFNNPEVAGASGRIIVPLPPHPTDHERNTTGLERSLFVTANCFYRKSALEAVGGFDERFKEAWREDSDLFFSLLESGFLLQKAPEAVVYHPVRRESWGISVREQHKSLYNALLYKKHLDLYRQHIQSAPPWMYYGMVFSLLIAVVGAVLHHPGLLWLGLGAWLGLLVVFSVQRLQDTSHSFNHILEMVITSILIPPLSIYWRIRGAVKYRVIFF